MTFKQVKLNKLRIIHLIRLSTTYVLQYVVFFVSLQVDHPLKIDFALFSVERLTFFFGVAKIKIGTVEREFYYLNIHDVPFGK